MVWQCDASQVSKNAAAGSTGAVNIVRTPSRGRPDVKGILFRGSQGLLMAFSIFT